MRTARFGLGLALALVVATPGAAQDAPTFDAQARVTEALEAVRPIAMNRDTVDWTAIEARARGIAAEASDTIDLLPAYHLIVWSLGDEHSFMQASDAQIDEWIRRNNRNRFLPDTPRPRASQSAFKRRTVSARDLALPNGRVAREVVVPAHSGDDPGDAYGNAVAGHLTATAGTCGYVIDLRGNTGGNMGPMILGLSPLMGEGYTIPAIADATNFNAVMRIENGGVVGLESPNATETIPFETLADWPEDPTLSTAPVAVMIDQATASSGEAVAIALRGRANTRFFGETTFGVASANLPRLLSDGITLHVTIALLRDSEGRTYLEGFPPDEAVATGPGRPDDPDDAVQEAAKSWLAQQTACATPAG